MSGRNGSLKEAKERFHKKLGTAEGAFEQAEHYLQDIPGEYGPGRIDSRLSKDVDGKSAAGAKRKKVPKIIRPLPGGQSLSVDEQIRAIAALETAGFPTRKIEDTLGITRKMSNQLACRNPDAFDGARADMVKYTNEKYANAMTFVVGAISEAAPIVMETFTGLMEDKEVSPTVRLKAASKMLDMMMVKGRDAANAGDVVRATGEVIAMMDKKSTSGEYIVDAEVENA